WKLLFRTLRAIRVSVRSQANGPAGGRFTSAILAWPCRAAHLSAPKSRRSRRLAQSPQVLCFLGKCRLKAKWLKVVPPQVFAAIFGLIMGQVMGLNSQY